MKTLLCSGQSNAEDHAYGGEQIIHPRVTVWNCASETFDATTGLGTAFIAPNPSQPPYIAGGVLMFVRAASYLAEWLNDDVRLILAPCGGRSIDNWVGPNGVPAVLLNRIFNVMTASGVTKVDGFGWHQGETYTTDYVTKFENLLICLREKKYITRTNPVVIGELAAQHVETNAALAMLSYIHPEIRLARMQHLPTTGDYVHFTGPSLNRAALEYAKHFMKAWTP